MSLNSTNSNSAKKCDPDSKIVFGIDEVGRGAFAGPLLIAALSFKPDWQCPAIFKDSKKLSGRQRQIEADRMRPYLFHLEYEYVTVEEIDRVGVGRAEEEGLKRLTGRLCQQYDNPYFVIDYFTVKDAPHLKQEGIVKGDEKVFSIAMASIYAKLERDSLMKELAISFPEYGWHTNAGYGTKEHREAIKTKGLTPHHRRSFCGL